MAVAIVGDHLDTPGKKRFLESLSDLHDFDENQGDIIYSPFLVGAADKLVSNPGRGASHS